MGFRQYFPSSRVATLLFSAPLKGRGSQVCPHLPLTGDQEGKIKPSINSREIECLEHAQFHLPAGKRLREGAGYQCKAVLLCGLMACDSRKRDRSGIPLCSRPSAHLSSYH